MTNLIKVQPIVSSKKKIPVVLKQTKYYYGISMLDRFFPPPMNTFNANGHISLKESFGSNRNMLMGG